MERSWADLWTRRRVHLQSACTRSITVVRKGLEENAFGGSEERQGQEESCKEPVLI